MSFSQNHPLRDRLLVLAVSAAMTLQLVPAPALAKVAGAAGEGTAAVETTAALQEPSKQNGDKAPLVSEAADDAAAESRTSAEGIAASGGSASASNSGDSASKAAQAEDNGDGAQSASPVDDAKAEGTSREVQRVRMLGTNGADVATPIVGSVLQAWAGSSDASEVADYDGLTIEWYRGGSRVQDARDDSAYAAYSRIGSGRTYVVSSSDLGSFIACRASYTEDNGSTVTIWTTSSTEVVRSLGEDSSAASVDSPADGTPDARASSSKSGVTPKGDGLPDVGRKADQGLFQAFNLSDLATNDVSSLLQNSLFAPTAQKSVTVRVIGPDADGKLTDWAHQTVSVPRDANGEDVTIAALKEAKLAYGGDSTYLSSITSPFDNKQYAWDAATGSYWQLFVDDAYSNVGMADVIPGNGSVITWCYSSSNRKDVAVRVVGPDARGDDSDWVPTTNVTIKPWSTGWDATASALDGARLEYKESSWGGLDSIKSPYTKNYLGTEKTESGNKSWALYVDYGSGLAHSSAGINQIDMARAKEILWYYSGEADEPAPSEPVDDEPSDVKLPDYSSDWSGFQNSEKVTDAATPTGDVKTAWTINLGALSSNPKAGYHSVSELLSVSGKIYVAIDDAVRRIDEKTGAVDKVIGRLDGSVDYTSRPLYVDGLIVIPLSGGRLQALNAETLKTRWLTPIQGSGLQTSTTLALAGGESPRIIAGMTGLTSSWEYKPGLLISVDPSNGDYKILDSSQDAGWYWSGPATVGGYVVMGDTSGKVSAYDVASNRFLTSYDLGSPINADAIALNDTDFLIATRDGKLHKLRFGSSYGYLNIIEVASIDLGGTGKAAPVISDGFAFIGGNESSDYAANPALNIVNVRDMSLFKRITLADGIPMLPTGEGNLYNGGGISAPVLVSKQAAGTYAYFTVNAGRTDDNYNYLSGGGLYRYKLGDDQAHLLFMGTKDLANTSDSPVIADSDGNLYYLNDSSHLVKLVSGKAGDSKASDDGSSKGDGSRTPTDDASSKTDSKVPTGTLQGKLRGSKGGFSLHSGSDASATAVRTGAIRLGLLLGESSGTLTTTMEPTDWADTAGSKASSGPEDDSNIRRDLPIWPIVGMACGAVALIGVAISLRKRSDHKEA